MKSELKLLKQVLTPDKARAQGILTKVDLKIIIDCLMNDPFLAPRKRRVEIAAKVQANIDRCWPKK